MKVIYNRLIPFKGYKAINIFGVTFVREGCIFTSVDYTHESIHTEQMKDLLYIGFYMWYIIEWVIRLFGKGNAYRNISFEREAYANQQKTYYLNSRKRFAFFKYLKKNKGNE